jgi:hypothetical protein
MFRNHSERNGSRRHYENHQRIATRAEMWTIVFCLDPALGLGDGEWETVSGRWEEVVHHHWLGSMEVPGVLGHMALRARSILPVERVTDFYTIDTSRKILTL